jgi:SAM-dependent methyltransferase
MKLIRRYADNSNPKSISNKFRRKRFKLFKSFINGIEKPVKILDVGGTASFWIQMGFNDSDEAQITLLNIDAQDISGTNFKAVIGDALNLTMFKDKEFDVVFSNSVIEHAGGLREQKKMANEILRTGKMYFVQTPNYYFPFEPHFLFPFFQFFPLWLKKSLLLKFNLGWYKKAHNKEEAEDIINSIKLLKKKDLALIFPNGKIFKEKFIFLTKSLIVYGKSD